MMVVGRTTVVGHGHLRCKNSLARGGSAEERKRGTDEMGLDERCV